MSPRQQIEEQAALWLVRREEPYWDAASAAELDQWLDESMAHKAAFWRLEQGWRDADRIGAIAAAPVWPAAGPRLGTLAGRFGWRPALAAALATALALPAWMLYEGQRQEIRYQTAKGEARTIRTADGSHIELNTATDLRTRVTSFGRDAWLERGEAFFDIHHDDAQPFRIHAGPKTITVLGTRFSVRRDGSRVTVAVESGRVRIDDSDYVGRAIRSSVVATGDIAVSSGSELLVASNVEARVHSLTAWRDGMIIFRQTPLAEAVTEFNRYSAAPMVVDDPALAGFRIGGSFRVDNRDGFLRLLNVAYGLQVSRERDAIHISRSTARLQGS